MPVNEVDRASAGGAADLTKKKSKKQLKLEAAAAAAEVYNQELVAKARARQAAIDAERKAEADARRAAIEAEEETERARIAELERIAAEEAAERARQRKLEEKRREAERIRKFIESAESRIQAGVVAAEEANKRWPNRVLNPAPHTTLYRLYTEVLDTLDKELPFENNIGRDFMVNCKNTIYHLEVATYPEVRELVADEALHVEASKRFQAWFEQQTKAGRFYTYEPPPFNPGSTRKLLEFEDGKGASRGPWTCANCKRDMEAKYCRCLHCSASHGYDMGKVNQMNAKTRAILEAKEPEKERRRRGIQHWLKGNQPDGFHYEDYI